MKLIFSLCLIYALCSSAAALQCDACADQTCSTTVSKTCSSETMCITASIRATSSQGSGALIYKDCAAASLCPTTGAATFSVALTFSSAIASAQCCNTANCNSQTLTFPDPPSANGRTCPVCDPTTSQCSSTVTCSGDQTSCFQATMTNGSATYPVVGCVSPNTCAAAASLNNLPFMESVGNIVTGPTCSAATIMTTVQPTISTTQETTTAAATTIETSTVVASTSTAPALPRPADCQLLSLSPGDFIMVKSFKRHGWNHQRWVGPFQILLTTQTAVKVAEQATWIHSSHCKKVPPPEEPPATIQQGHPPTWRRNKLEEKQMRKGQTAPRNQHGLKSSVPRARGQKKLAAKGDRH